MTNVRWIICCVIAALAAPSAAHASAASCDDFAQCFEGTPCADADLLEGITFGAVDGIADLLCFVGDPKCSCFVAITDDPNGDRFNEFLAAVETTIDGCQGTAAGSRTLSGVAFEAASSVCTPTFADVDAILQPTCATCHVAVSSGSFSFASGRSDLVGVPSTQSSLPYVAPGDPEGSYLWHKLNGTQASVGGSGQSMPLGGSSLPADQLDTIEAWILAGARP